MNRKKIIINNQYFVTCLALVYILIFNVRVFAQQEPSYTQYNFNIQVINPAYAGVWENLGFMVLGRHQWAGMEGAPTTYSLSVQSPTRNRNVALGVNILNDKAGMQNQTMINADYSYRLQLNDDNYVRLGIKGGVTGYTVNFSDHVGYPGDEPDPVFMGDNDMRILPNFGVGAYLYSEDYYLGVSVPKILSNKVNYEHTNFSTLAEIQHLYLMGGYIYEISKEVQFKPTMLTRYTWGAPLIVDLSANFLLSEKVWLGANYRLGDSFGLVAQWILENNIRIGYGVDISTSSLRSLHSGTHEVMISYEIRSRRRWSSPRMF